MVDSQTDTMATVVSMTFLLVPSDVRVSASVWLQASGRDALVRLTDGRWCGLGTFNRNWVAYSNYIRDVRKPNFCSVSVYKNPNRTEPNRSQKVKSEISVSAVFLKTEFVSYI